jgi:hypothetical protein
MQGRTLTRAGRLGAALLLIAGVMAMMAATAGAEMFTPIYNSIPSPLPGNVPSQAFEATSTSEFGGEIETSGPSETYTKVTIGMSSWACQSGGAEDGSCVTSPGAKFEWPVTVHIFAVGPGNSVGTQVASLTKTFKMPYRPTASTKCTGPEHLGGWYSAGHCYHGKLFKVSFVVKGVTIPRPAIIAAAYNTSDFGVEPQRSKAPKGGPYDSLNVAVTGAPTVGSDPIANSAFLSSTWSGAYCDKGAGGTGSFRLDSGCWGGLQPEIAVETHN